MTLFNFFKKKSETLNRSNILPTEEETENGVSQEALSSNIKEAKTPVANHFTVSCATGWPIDLIYGSLHKNYEEQGYSDAMLNNNFTFRDINMSIIRNKVLMIFREVNLKYDSMIKELDTRINTCRAAGLLTSVAELEKQMAIINAHKEELNNLEMDFRNNANEASVPLMSYECGFLRGVSAIAMSVPSAPTQDETQIPSAPFFSASRVTA